MEIACRNLTHVLRSERRFKYTGYSKSFHMPGRDNHIKRRWNLGGHDWEIRVYPHGGEPSAPSWVAINVVLLSECAVAVVTTIRGCLVDPKGVREPSEEICRSVAFRKPQDKSSQMLLMPWYTLNKSRYLKDDSFIVQCTLEVLKELPDIPEPEVHVPVPTSNLHQHFAELLQSQMGADVTFLVSGESIVAHKYILAVRSRVFKAAFLGDMIERGSECVEIKDMEAAVFKALLHFIYTDTVLEFEQQAGAEAMITDTVPESRQQDEAHEQAASVMALAQHLLAAADRYGLDRLKLICARKLYDGIKVDTAATTLAFAEQYNCWELQKRCADFITKAYAGSSSLDAVAATEGTSGRD
ncbi:BTB/POZ and MATH domain-containing protein 1-like [Triticum aestivum]|nr:BTB/POZ and MATH domain-containing protein 1-like [Triticum aestivum]XP_044445433.1 BTB/POZ and MATH domain-containing protein 1-like [Triticum aestivum]